MKKFVSIVIALVMVLSMTSAFALNNCSTPSFGWDCYTEIDACGKGAVDVVPYVKSTIACQPYYEFTANECAGILPSETLYFAVKVDVEANPDLDWWAAAELEIEVDGVAVALNNTGLAAAMAKLNTIINGAAYDASEAHTFYLKNDGGFGWVEDEDAEFDAATNLLFSGVASKKSAEVCITLSSEDDGVGVYNWGDWWVNSSALTFDADGKADGTLRIQKEGAGVVTYTIVDGEVTAVAGAKADVEEANATFNLGCGWVCVIEDAVQANFGWDDEQEDCYTWGAVQATIVNPECSVEIPKTGDVSVVAYAVMAIAAAAGMLKK